MSRERWFHGGIGAAAFDWRWRANQLDVARGLYDRAMQRTIDEWHAEELLSSSRPRMAARSCRVDLGRPRCTVTDRGYAGAPHVIALHPEHGTIHPAGARRRLGGGER
jgi:hypothetical protein